MVAYLITSSSGKDQARLKLRDAEPVGGSMCRGGRGVWPRATTALPKQEGAANSHPRFTRPIPLPGLITMFLYH